MRLVRVTAEDAAREPLHGDTPGLVAVLSYLLLVSAASFVSHLVFSLGACGEASSRDLCDFMSSPGGDLLFIAPPVLLIVAVVFATLWRLPSVLHLAFGVLMTAILVFDVAASW